MRGSNSEKYATNPLQKDRCEEDSSAPGFLTVLAILLLTPTICSCCPTGSGMLCGDAPSTFLWDSGSAGGVVEVTSHSSYMNHESWKELFSGLTYTGEFFHVVGEVKNVGNVDIAYEVNVSLYDSNENLVEGRRYWRISGIGDNLAPAQRRPFLLILLDENSSRDIARYEVSALIRDVEVESPYLANFINHTFRSDAGKVLGEIENILNRTMEHPYVYVTFYDAAGRAIGAGYDPVMAVDRLAPGEKAPFELDLSYHPSAWYSSIASYDLCPSYSLSFKIPYDELQILDYEPGINEYGNCEVTGHIGNIGAMTAKFVKVVVALYDKEGEMLRCLWSYPQPSSIDSGETASFSIHGSVGKEWVDQVGAYELRAFCDTYTKTQSTISCHIHPVSIALDDVANLTGRISPGPVREFVTLFFTNPCGETKTRSVRTDAESGGYTYHVEPDLTGRWTVKAYWKGKDDMTNATSLPVSFDVMKRTDIFPIEVEDGTFWVQITSNSSTKYFSYNIQKESILYRATYSTHAWYWSLPEIMGETNVTIPKALLDTPFTVFVDKEPITAIVTANTTHSSLHFDHPLPSFGLEIMIEGTVSELGSFVIAFLSAFVFVGLYREAGQ